MSLMNDALRKRDRERTQTPAPEGSFQGSGRRAKRKWYLWLAAVVLIVSSVLAGIHLVQSTAGDKPLMANHKAPGALPLLVEKAPMPSANGKGHEATSETRTHEANAPLRAEADATQSPKTNEDNPVQRPPAQVSAVSKPDVTVDDNKPQTETSRKVVRNDTQPALPATAARNQTDDRRPRDLEPIPVPLAPTGKKIPVAEPSFENNTHHRPDGDVRSSTTTRGRPEYDNADIDATGVRSSDQIEPFYRKALANHREGRLSEALRFYRKVLLSDPDHRGAMMNLSAIFLAQANYREAQSLLTRLEHTHPRPPGVLLNLAIAAIGIGDYSTALGYLDRARQESDAPTWDIQFHRAVAYSHMNRPHDALKIYETALTERPDDTRLRFNLAVTYDRLGQYEKALPHYEMVARYDVSSTGVDEAAIAYRIKTIRRHLDEKRQREKGR